LLQAQRQRAELELGKTRGDLASESELCAVFEEKCLHLRNKALMIYGYLLNAFPRSTGRWLGRSTTRSGKR
jgi:hypothetical protein